MSAGARTVLPSIGLGMALLCGCTTAIAGEPTAIGEPRRTTESQAPEPTEEEPTEEPEPTQPAPSSPEGIACDFGAQATPNVVLLVSLAIFEEQAEISPIPGPGRESTAQVLDALLLDTQPMLDALAPGAIREAFTQLRTDSGLLRDALRAPATGLLLDSVDDGFVAASQGLETACRAG